MFDLAALCDWHALWALVVNTLLHELGVPLPMSPVALLVGARVAAGGLNPVLPVIAIVAATMIGNTVWFVAGRRHGARALKLVDRLSMSADGVGRAETAFGRWGASSLVIGRFVPGVSLVAPPLAGALGMTWRKFLMWTAVGSTLYGIVVVSAGMLFRAEIESAWAMLSDFGWQMLAAGVAALLLVYLAWLRGQRRGADENREAERASAADCPCTEC
jgi:membrane protein DedA with SNARE-associated domain